MVRDDALYSPDWFRVSGLVLRIKPTVRIGRQRIGDQVWHIYRDEAFGRQMRLNGPAHRFAGRLDGRMSVDVLWGLLLDEAGDEVPSQHEVVALIQQLADTGLIAVDHGADLARLSRREAERRLNRMLVAVNPLSFRVPLGEPGRLLEATWRAVAPLYTPWALAAFVALLAFAGAVALGQIDALLAYGAAHVPTPGFAFALWLVYPPMKALHELAHAWAVRTAGGRVPEIGLTLMLGMPVPYVDASAAAMFPSRARRVATSLAGIVAELLCAAAALWVWLSVEDGWLRTAAFAAMTIGAVSTVLVNGNPLMRFDGYYAFADALDLPNLAERSRRAWGALARRIVAGERDVAPAGTARELPWLLGWGLASWVYRVALFAWLAAWIAPYSRPLALLALAWGLWLAVGRGLRDALRFAWTARWRSERPVRAVGGMAVAATLVVAAVALVPVPETATLPGVVMPAESARVRSPEAGRVVELLVAPGDPVRAGAPLARLESLPLETQLAQARAQLAAKQAERIGQLDTDRAAAGVAQDEIDRLRARIADLQRRLAALVLRATADGVVAWTDRDGPLERQVRQGDTLLYVLQPDSIRIQALARDDETRRLRDALEPGAARVRVADQPGLTLAARAAAQTPQAVRQLPGAALGEAAGGPIATDPTDRDGLRTLEPWFQLDFVPDGPMPRIGSSASVRVDLPPRPVAAQAGDVLRRLFLRRLEG
ncbi:MAG: hypothetical protein RJA99_3951 [Pseudomonadota bacterium]|jgi:putative peptide zinc metalloprotease protein